MVRWFNNTQKQRASKKMIQTPPDRMEHQESIDIQEFVEDTVLLKNFFARCAGLQRNQNKRKCKKSEDKYSLARSSQARKAAEGCRNGKPLRMPHWSARLKQQEQARVNVF
jgi:hypothetical protein